jgi:3alpha(or 20beta)-hydroxysteroid dehydrogenase
MGLLDGKTAIVTGAANGQGAAAARRFAAEGARVVLTDIDEPNGRKVAGEIGQSAMFLRHDISKKTEWAEVTAAAAERFGPVGILLNNAGILLRASIEETSEEQLEHVIRVNVIGAFLGMRAVIGSMKQLGGGSIINVSSVGGMGGHPHILAYGTSKYAVRGLTHHAARDLGKYGIRVNAIMPGIIDTQMIGSIEDKVKQSWLASIPMGRIGTPDECATVALFLASDLSRYISGADIVVDAGQTT